MNKEQMIPKSEFDEMVEFYKSRIDCKDKTIKAQKEHIKDLKHFLGFDNNPPYNLKIVHRGKGSTGNNFHPKMKLTKINLNQLRP